MRSCGKARAKTFPRIWLTESPRSPPSLHRRTSGPRVRRRSHSRRRQFFFSLLRVAVVEKLAHDFNFPRFHFLAVKREVAAKRIAFEHQRKPVPVILPHFVKRDRLHVIPKWRGLRGLDRLAFAIESEKDRAVQAVAIGKLEIEFAAF